MLLVVSIMLSVFASNVEAKSSQHLRPHKTEVRRSSYKKTMRKVKKNHKSQAKGLKKHESNISRPACSRKSHASSNRM